MLRGTDLSISEIALQTGWQSLGTFGRIFRDITGESPGELRAREGERLQGKPHRERALVPECLERAASRPDLKMSVSEKRRDAAAG